MKQKYNLFMIATVYLIAAFVAGRISTKQDNSYSFGSSNDATKGQPTESDFGVRQRRSSLRTAPAARADAGLGELVGRGRNQLKVSTEIKDPYLRLAIIKANPDPLEQLEQMKTLIENVGPEEAGLLYSRLRSHGMSMRNRLETGMIKQAFARHYPEVALEKAEKTWVSGFSRQNTMFHFVDTDPQAAIRWAKANNVPDSGAIGSLLEYTIQAVATSDPNLATQLLSELDSPLECDRALETLSLQYMEQGLGVARDWAMSLDNKQLRNGAVAKIAKEMAWTDPRGAADWLIANPSKQSAQVMGDVMRRITRADASYAINYLDKIDDPGLKASAQGAIVDELGVNNSKSPVELTDANPASVNDEVIAEFIRKMRKSDREASRDTIDGIKD